MKIVMIIVNNRDACTGGKKNEKKGQHNIINGVFFFQIKTDYTNKLLLFRKTKTSSITQYSYHFVMHCNGVVQKLCFVIHICMYVV